MFGLINYGACILGRCENRTKLLILMFFSHIYNPVRRYYVDNSFGGRVGNLEKLSVITRNHQAASKQQQQQMTDADDGAIQVKKQPTTDSSAARGRASSSSTIVATTAAADKCASEDLPKVKRTYYSYYLFSTFTHAIGIFQSAALISIFQAYFELDLHWNCYILGRLSIHEDAIGVVPSLQFSSNLLHSLWRYFNSYYEKAYRLDCIVFMMQDPAQLSRRIQASPRKFHKLQLQSTPPLIAAGNYIENVLYFESVFQDESRRRILRPNRTLRAHVELSEYLDKILAWCLLAVGILVLSIAPNVINTALFDYQYIKNYPTCSPELERLNAEGKLSVWSVTFYPVNYRTLCAPMDFLINFFTLVDNCIGLIFPSLISILLTKDLLLYWHWIRVRLDRLLENLRSASDRLELSDRMMSVCGAEQAAAGSEQAATLHRRYLAERLIRLDLPSSMGSGDHVTLLQDHIIDFFIQLRAYDKYVSLMVFLLFLTWITIFVTTSFIAIRLNNVSALTLIRVMQIFVGAALSGAVYGLLKLKRSTKDAYPVLSAIMAHERLYRRKMRWSQILQYYTYRPAYGFTILHTYELSWLSFFNCIGSSISFFIVVETLRRADSD